MVRFAANDSAPETIVSFENCGGGLVVPVNFVAEDNFEPVGSGVVDFLALGFLDPELGATSKGVVRSIDHAFPGSPVTLVDHQFFCKN